MYLSNGWLNNCLIMFLEQSIIENLVDSRGPSLGSQNTTPLFRWSIWFLDYGNVRGRTDVRSKFRARRIRPASPPLSIVAISKRASSRRKCGTRPSSRTGVARRVIGGPWNSKLLVWCSSSPATVSSSTTMAQVRRLRYRSLQTSQKRRGAHEYRSDLVD